MRRRAGRSLALVVIVAMAVLGCGGGAAPTGPGATDVATSSAPALSDDERAVCDGTVRMGEAVRRLEGIRVRRGAASTLLSTLESLLEGQRLVLDHAPGRMRSQVRTLGFAVTNLTIAIEGFRTADRIEAAASTIRRRTTALSRAVERFRSWVGCPSPVPGAGVSVSAPPASADPGP